MVFTFLFLPISVFWLESAEVNAVFAEHSYAILRICFNM